LIIQGQALVLEVEVEGQPKKVKWYKAGNELKDAKTEDLGNGKYRLTVPDFKDSDVGEYSVTAENDVGEVESKAKVTVQAPDDGKGKPQIVSGLVPTTVKQGETATLSVKVKGPVKYKNGKEVPDAKTTDKGDGTYELTVPNAQKEDAAEYKVVVANDDGDAESAAALTVKVPQIEVVKGLADITVPQKQTGTLEIEVNKAPKQVKWYKNGKEITPSDKAQPKKVDENKYQLVIPDAGKDDTAEYKVVLTDEDGNTAESACALTVKMPGAIEIVKGLEDTSAAKGQKVVLAIETSATPKQIKWYKNGKELSPSDKAKPEKIADNKYQLAIPDADKEDTADYKVVLTDDDGNNAESSCALTVKLPGAIPIEIVKGLEDTSVAKGEKVVLAIETSATPKQIKWYKNGKELSPSDKAKPEKIADNKYQLAIPDADKEDTADYKVVLTDDDGNNAESSCALTVKLPGAVPIEIVKGLEDTSVAKGEKVVLPIETSATPKQIKWYKNGKELSPSDKAKPEKIADNKYQLAIPDADKEDTADYKVVLTDDDGNNAESSCALTVKLPGAIPIEIVKGLEDTSVAKGEKVVLPIETSAKPKQIKWYKNGKELSPSDKAKPEKVTDTKYQLAIPDTGKDDTADYKVVLTDDDGNTAESSCALTVKLPGIEIVKGLEDTSVPKGQKAVLAIETSRPPKEIKWSGLYKNGKELTPSDKAKPEKVADNKYQLVIPDTGKDDTADYKVVLTDDEGNSADSSCALTVKLPAPIEITKGLEDTTVPQGQKAVLEVETSRAPKQVKWYKNGKELAPSDKPQQKQIGDNKHQLVIPNSSDEDTADYKVILTDDDDNTADSFCSLTVRLPDKEPKIIKGLFDRIVPCGLPTIWEVETENEPRIVKWYKNGKELAGAAAAQVKISKIDDNHYTLEIKKCALEDTGEYKVEVENDAGKAKSSGKLTVEPQLTFLTPLKDQEITEGENAEFQVETNAKPRTVKWYKNGQEIKQDARTIITEEETKFKLVIKNATRDDAADYKVVLTNSAGDVDSSAKLTVKKAKPGVPKIIKGLEDQVVAKGASLIFEVKVEGEVEEVRWAKDTTPITAGTNAVIEKIDDKTYRLTIPKADLNDAGHYSVEAVNESGKVCGFFFEDF
ncbi:immunoglobulin I-set domain protein, partial [Ancylostoma duodenale]